MRRGAVFSLDYPLDAFMPSPTRPPARHSIVEMGPGWRDDYLDSFYLQQTSQVDGLRHAAHPVYGFYGGTSADRLVPGDPTIGINRWAERGVVGRGVLVDTARYREAQGRPLDHDAGEPITPELLNATLAAQGSHLEQGDMVLLRTNYPSHFRARPPTADTIRSAGLVQSHPMVSWLWDQHIPLIASDNFAVECIPPSPESPFPASADGYGGLVHPQLIALLGMVLGELWRLDDLATDCAADGIYEFLLVVKPLDVIGGVGSPPNATAVK